MRWPKEQRSRFIFISPAARSRMVKLWSAATVVTWGGSGGGGEGSNHTTETIACLMLYNHTTINRGLLHGSD